MIALQKKVVNARRSAWGRQRRLEPRVGQEAWPGHVNLPVSRFPQRWQRPGLQGVSWS